MPVVVQLFDMVVDVPVVQIVDVCVQFLDTVIDMPVVVHVVFVVLKTVEVPQLQYLDKVVDVFFVQFIDGVDVPVIMQRRVVSSTVEVPQIQFTGRVVDIPVVQQRRVQGWELGGLASPLLGSSSRCGDCVRGWHWLPFSLGRGQVVLCGFCLSEVRSCSVASAWPRSGRVLCGLLGRVHCDVGLWFVHFKVPLSYRFQAGCFSALLSWFVSRHSARSRVEDWWLSCLLCISWLPLSSLPCVSFMVSLVFRVVSIAFLLGSTCYPLLRRSLVALDDSVFHVQVYVEC